MGFDYIGFQARRIEEAKKLGVYPAWIMYWLLFAWNKFHRKDGFRLTDKQLMELSTVKSRETLLDAKKKLEASGLIEYVPSRKKYGTLYRIRTEV